MKLIYSLLATTALADFKLEMRLCTDKNTDNGMAKEAVGKKGAFYIQLDGGKRQQVQLPYNVRKADLMTATMQGDLEVADYVHLEYVQRDILCLEKLKLTTMPKNKNDAPKSYNIIQDYDPWAWDVTRGEQSWVSKTNKKISYWTKDCIEDTRYLTTTIPFLQSCHNAVKFSIQPVDECADARLNQCDANAVCTDTSTSYTCQCKPGFMGSGVNMSVKSLSRSGAGCRPDPNWVPPTTTTTTSTTVSTTPSPEPMVDGWCSREDETEPPAWLKPWPRMQGCKFPSCDAHIQVIDSWKKRLNRRSKNERWVYGWSAMISVPAKHYDGDGFSILLRLPKELERGSFQVWNMNFWNFYRGHHGGFDVLLHQKHWIDNDTTDKHSFLIVAERLSTPELPSLLFWDDRQKRHQCFDPSMHRSGHTRIQEAVLKTDNIDDIENITKLVVNRDGLRRIRAK